MPLRFGAVKVTTQPASEPLSVAQAKAQLRVTHPDDDEYIAGLITVAREWAEDYTRRAFLTQSLDVLYPRWPDQLYPSRAKYDSTFIVPRPPLQSVTSLQYYDETDTLQTLDPSQYNVDFENDPALIRVKQTAWPIIPFAPILSYNYANPVILKIVAGYGAGGTPALPARVAQAMAIMVAHLYERRTPIEIDVRIVMVQIPFCAQELLNPLRLRMV